jgi:hypothetical protein
VPLEIFLEIKVFPNLNRIPYLDERGADMSRFLKILPALALLAITVGPAWAQMALPPPPPPVVAVPPLASGAQNSPGSAQDAPFRV